MLGRKKLRSNEDAVYGTKCPEKFEEFPGLSPRNLPDFRGNVNCMAEFVPIAARKFRPLLKKE